MGNEEKSRSFNRKLNTRDDPRLITKILAGVDGSENSEKALDYALEIANKFSASILILNVFQLPPEIGYQLNMFQQTPASGYPQESMDYQSIIKEFRKVHEAVLSRATERANKLKPAPLKSPSNSRKETYHHR